MSAEMFYPIENVPDIKPAEYPNVHIQRASGDGANCMYTVWADGEKRAEVDDGRFADFVLSEGNHIIEITAPGLISAAKIFEIQSRKKKIHFYVRNMFGKIEIYQFS